MRQLYLCTVFLAGLLLWASNARAQKLPDPTTIEFFENRVRPVLANNCYSCHGRGRQQGGVRLDGLDQLLKAGPDGAPVVPGYADRSLLLRVVRYDGKIKMPPSGKLNPEEIEALTTWIKMGAPWPSGKPSAATSQSGGYVITDQRRRFWAFQPVKKPAVPAVKTQGWVISPVDRFVLAALEKRGLTPNPRADRRILIRRAYYDLIGLPPTADEVDAFVADRSPDAFSKLVDRLLTSPRYGERWGRYWLDVARYADNKGYVFEEDRVYHNAYTYRDYVIRAFNEDLPYNRFILEQLAADRLPLGEDRRPLAALGFLTLGRRFLNNPHDIIDDRIDVTMRGLEGLTVGCARCHDHKFDPISQRDYYALYGVYASSTEPKPPLSIAPKSVTEPYERQNAQIFAAEKEANELALAQVAALRTKVKDHPDSVPAPVRDLLQKFREGTLPAPKEQERLAEAFEPAVRDRFRTLRQTAETLRKTLPPAPETAPALIDLPAPVTPHVLKRGNPNNPGDEVPRRFPQILGGDDAHPFIQGSGRLELAEAIASPTNPLTARVLVNRVWLHHFGYGLVRTPSDFGTRGEPPTHPALLDYLAARFVEGGWSIKKLHRLIMLSSTYMQTSDCPPARLVADPENRLLSHQNRQRLDLEAMRDSLLMVSGHLDTSMGGPSVDILKQPFSGRRSVYSFIDRQNLPAFYRTFDFASPDSSSAQRYRTTVPQQALFLMNSPFVLEQARALAHRPDVEAISEPAARIRFLYRAIYARSPDAEEVALGLRFVAGGSGLALASSQPSAQSLDRWSQYVQTLLMTNEFAFVD